VIAASGKAAAWIDKGMYASDKLLSQASLLKEVRYPDFIAHEKARLQTLRKASPHESRYAVQLAKYNLGWYVPEGRIFPLGDNRDNSRDGRYFGPVRVSRVLGRGLIIYWPYWRMGSII
jgi:signal peptidase I